MKFNTFGRVIGRFAAIAVCAATIAACGISAEDPPRAMYGRTAWSDGWQVTCTNRDPDAEPKSSVNYHVKTDCAQYEVAQRMQYHQPAIAAK